MGGAVAIGAASGLIACGAADGAAVFGASARGGVSGRSGSGRRCRDWRPAGPIAGEAADGAAVFGASVESGEAGAAGAVAIGAPSGPILCAATSMAAALGGTGVSAGAAGREGACGLNRLSVLRRDQALRRGDGGLALRQVWSFVHESKAHANRRCARQREPAGYQFPASGTGPGRLLKVGPPSDRRRSPWRDGRFPGQFAIAGSPGFGERGAWAPSTRRAAERQAHALTIPAPASTPRACLQRSLAALGRLALA